MSDGHNSEFILAPYMRLEAIPLWLALFSMAMLGTALVFQYVGGLFPCELCIQQRIPHGAVIALGIFGYILGKRGSLRPAARMCGLIAISLLIGAGIAAHHVGVEQHWWQSAFGCTAGQNLGGNFDDMAEQLMNAPLIACDQIAWSLFGISMAGYNFILSLGAALIAVWAAIKLWQRERPSNDQETQENA